MHLELLPFTQSELDGRPIQGGVSLQGSGPESRAKHDGKKILMRYLETGGLPGVCFIRSVALRAQRFESQLETILDRDLRLILATKLPFQTLRNVLVNLSLMQGEPLDLSALARKTRVSTPTH